ncbi:MAG: HNH endonuclease family protein [Actinomycetota bacterium]|nr:HNH endonuclease family protein [Actinomycetota bacterium]
MGPDGGTESRQAPPRRPIGVVLTVLVAAGLLMIITVVAVVGVAVSSHHSGSAARPASHRSGDPLSADALIAGARPGTALAALGQLAVREPVKTPPYSREVFGLGWTDLDRNGCETRSDILRRDLTATTIKPDSGGCIVTSGDLNDPYTGRTIHFREGAATLDVQIDHVVSLADAWQKGAQQWTAAQRTAFVNDPVDLLAVDAAARLDKGDRDATAWLPPDAGYGCSYVARQVAVKVKYRLWVSAPERAAIAHVLAKCAGQPLPDAAPQPFGGAPVQPSA